MIEAMAQSRRNFCRRNCFRATERGGCTVRARPERVGPQFPRRGGASRRPVPPPRRRYARPSAVRG